jgi:hypothetical protein
MSEVKRWFQYHPQTKKPVLCLAPVRPRSANPVAFVLPLSQAYTFADPNMAVHWGVRICHELDLGEPTPSRVADILTTIVDGLDELVFMKPFDSVYDDPKPVVAEGDLIVVPTGERIPFQLMN